MSWYNTDTKIGRHLQKRIEELRERRQLYQKGKLGKWNIQRQYHQKKAEDKLPWMK